MTDKTGPSVEETAAALRARNERFQAGMGNYLYYSGSDSKLDCEAADHLTRLSAEVERLREALRKISRMVDSEKQSELAVGSLVALSPAPVAEAKPAPAQHSKAVKEIRALIDALDTTATSVGGCSNGSCVVTGKAKGQHTNGGCHCWQDRMKAQRMMLEGRILRDKVSAIVESEAKPDVLAGRQPIETAPKDGTQVLVSDGSNVWISSRVLPGHRSKDGMPLDGHDWFIQYGCKTPLYWADLPKISIRLGSTPTRTDVSAGLIEALRPFADVADFVDAETEGFSDSDEFDLFFKDCLIATYTLDKFKSARAAIEASERARAGVWQPSSWTSSSTIKPTAPCTY